jgi:sulfur-carrier protein
MPITIHLGGHLKSFTRGKTEVALEGKPSSINEALDLLWKLHPGLRDRVLNEQGEIRQHVNVFLGSEDVKRMNGLSTKVTDDEIHIFNAVSGG